MHRTRLEPEFGNVISAQLVEHAHFVEQTMTELALDCPRQVPATALVARAQTILKGRASEVGPQIHRLAESRTPVALNYRPNALDSARVTTTRARGHVSGLSGATSTDG